jgi:alpha 1,6-mannosyltransferase
VKGLADRCRYLVLLVHGGVYTDTDTACVRPIDDWALHPDQKQSHPLLDSLPDLIRLIDEKTETVGTKDEGGGGPSLLVSIEADARHTGQDWRKDTLVRGLQIAQWTILAKRGHPILLDVLGRALMTARAIREREELGEVVDIPDIVSEVPCIALLS